MATPSKNFPKQRVQLRPAVMVNNTPSPPFQQLVYPALGLSTGGPLKEVHNYLPELDIVEVPIDRLPGGD